MGEAALTSSTRNLLLARCHVSVPLVLPGQAFCDLA